MIRRGKWVWFGRLDSPGNSNFSEMLKDSDTIFRVYLRPLPMVVWHHIALEYIRSYSFCASFSFFDERDVILRFHNEAAHDRETYNFIEQLLEAPLGYLGSVKTFWYFGIKYVNFRYFK